jgi:hypothetical protein
MTTSHLCLSFRARTNHQGHDDTNTPAVVAEEQTLSSSSSSSPTTVTASVVTTTNRRTVIEDDPDEDLIPTWDDENGIIHQLFNDEESENNDGGTSAAGRYKREEWLFSDSSEEEEEEEQEPHGRAERDSDEVYYAIAEETLCDDEEDFPGMSWQGRDLFPLHLVDNSVEPTEETTDDDDDDSDSVLEGDDDEVDSNEENHGESSNNNTPSHNSNNNTNRSIAANEDNCRFSLPKSLLQKSTNYSVDKISCKSTSPPPSPPRRVVPPDFNEAVHCRGHDEVWIRADLLHGDQLPDVLDLMRGFHSTRRIVVEEVHQGSIVEALLIYLFQSNCQDTDYGSNDGGSGTLRSLSYSGSWISPSLVEHLASTNCQLEELELGISLYRNQTGQMSRSRPGRRQPSPRRNIARQLQRLDELEEALAANTSLRALSFLSGGHLKATEGLIWAASCHPHIERMGVVVPVYTPQNTVDVHESGLLLFEGIKELMRKCTTLHSLSLYIDPNLCTLRKKSHEILRMTSWQHFTQALADSQHLTDLNIEFSNAINEGKASSLIPRDMSLNMMKALMKNTSLQSLTLVNVPVQTSIDFWHGVQMRKTPFAEISLHKCAEVLSFCMCANDTDSEQHGWLKLKSLHVDQASLSEDLYGLEVLLHGGVKELVITDTLCKKDVKQLISVMNDSTLESLIMGSDSPHLLTELRSESLKSFQLHGGQFPVSSEAVCALLDECPSLQDLRLTRVKVVGDWNEVVQRMETHTLQMLDMEE